ncbi:MAG: nickel-responsive transcriptional regulator NikR [Actinobacteria bacterium]|nr:nickel-responsive transcriptional regulator NikR [Actinomycetota bacterium]
METLKRFGVSIEAGLLNKFDRYVSGKKYPNRSEAIRDLIRNELVGETWKSGNEEVAGAIIMVYDHHRKELTDNLVTIQHNWHHIIISTQHVHLDHDMCLEVVVVKGKINDVCHLEAELKVPKGVKHVSLAKSTLAHEI